MKGYSCDFFVARPRGTGELRKLGDRGTKIKIDLKILEARQSGSQFSRDDIGDKARVKFVNSQLSVLVSFDPFVG